jgi:sulfur transfer protein SufE
MLLEAERAEGAESVEQHLTPQRSNGVRAMVERIRADAAAA